MRMLLVMLLAGCLQRTTGQPGDPVDPGDPGTPVVPVVRCHDDGECRGGDVCARNSTCLPPSDVHAAHVNWTVQGMAANQAACGAMQDLTIDFTASGSKPHPHLSYAPVPCEAGRFTIDKLPTKFDMVGLGIRQLDLTWTSIDATTGEAALDLMF